MRDMEATLRTAEKQREGLAAVLRVFVFLALLATVLSLQGGGAHHHPVLALTVAYGVLALAGIALAWLGIFHWLLPVIFVTIEVVLVAGQTVLMGSLMGQHPMSLAALPVATVIFVIISHAAMRYRPWLIIYAAGLFLSVLWLAGLQLSIPDALHPAAEGLRHDTVHHQLFPPLMIVLTATILFITARGTRRLLHMSISERIALHRLSRFFAPDIANRLTGNSDEGETNGAVQPVAVLFSDIRGFSLLAEKLTPFQLTEFLGEFRGILAKVIRDQGGVVDKFIGDAVMAVFGFPVPGAASASNCLTCAYAILERMEAWSRERVAQGKPAVSIGIGVHFGEAFVGVVGSDDLLEFTVIGDTVNIAERMERMTRSLRADIVVSRPFADAAGLEPESAGWTYSGAQTMAGHSQPIDVLFFRDDNHLIDR